MLRLALLSIRFRTPAFLAAFASMLLGTVIVMSFSSLIDTSRGAGVSVADQENLKTMAMVVGGSGLVIVLFSVTTTLTLAVRQRSAEIALLKSVGATPAQVRRMIVGEAAILALVAAALAVPISMLTGRALMRMLLLADLVAADTPHRFGLGALGAGVCVTLLASTAAAWLTARRTAQMGVAESLLNATREQIGLSRKRVVAGSGFIAIGLSCAAVAALGLGDAEVSIIQIVSGEASLLSAIGLAILSPALVRTMTATVAGAIRPLTETSGYLAMLNLRQRPHQMAGSLAPIILLTAVATGTLYSQSIDNSIVAAGGPLSSDAKGVEALNYTIVAMICTFAAIMVVNSLIAATTYRRREFGQQRLVGFTPRQVLLMVGAEGFALTMTGLILGSIAGLLTVIPYNIARTDTVLPDVTGGIYVSTVILVAVLSFASSLGAAGRAVHTPAVETVAA